MTKAIAAGLAAVVSALLAWPGHSRSPAVSTLAVLRTHVAYEATLIDDALPRLSAADAGHARAVRDATSAQAERLSDLLTRQGYPAARAQALWSRLIGDGVPPPSRALQYVCSVHVNGDHAELAAAPAAQVGTTLGAIELTLMVEGQQLSRQLGGSLGAANAAGQRSALRLLAPLLLPTDRAYASGA